VVQVRVSSRVLRTIDKLGGLDEYLLGEKEGRIKELGESGWWLRWAIMQTGAIKKRFRLERAELGLSQDSEQNEVLEEAFENLALAETSTEQLMEETEPVPMDGAFTVEPSADMPVIKFRVAPGKHVMLTPDGWRRTRPSPEHWQKPMKETIAAGLRGSVNAKVQVYTRMLEKEQADPNAIRLSEETRARLIRMAKKRYEAELQPRVEAQFQRKLQSTRMSKLAKNQRKVEKKRATTGWSAEGHMEAMQKKASDLQRSVKLLAEPKV
jgi:large subunit ribosomal protein L28